MFCLPAWPADVLLTVEPDAESILVDEHFTVRVRVALASPLANAPAFLLPWLPIGDSDDKSPLPVSLGTPSAPPSQPRANFAVVFSAQQVSGGSSFSQQRILNAALPETQEEADGKSWSVYTLPVEFQARKEGVYTFGAPAFQAKVKDQSGRIHPVSAQARPLTIKVVPPPLENQPASFIGAICPDLTLEAALDSHAARVGDPLTLTLTVRGASLSPESLQPPRLGRQPGIGKTFRVYDDSVSAETLPDGKRFTYRVRPLVAGSIEFPPVEAAFFDRDTRTYQIRKSAPVPLQVQATTQITAVGGDPEGAAEAKPMPAGITLDPEGATANAPLTPSARFLWLTLGLPAALHAGLSTTRLSRRALRRLRDRQRRCGACSQTLRRLKKADAPEALHHIRIWLGNRLGVPSAGLTPPDIARLLAERGAPHEELCAAVEALEARLYQAGADTALPQETRKRLRAILPEIDAILAQWRPS